MASYNYFIVNFQAMKLLKLRLFRLKLKNIIVAINPGHHSET